jgi:hypothetical protein
VAFFQSNFAIRQRSKNDSAAFGPEVASDIVFRGAHRGICPWGLQGFRGHSLGTRTLISWSRLACKGQAVGIARDELLLIRKLSYRRTRLPIPDERELVPTGAHYFYCTT